MLTIGLTGRIGSGKSSVSRWFMAKGVQVLDADQIAHGILARDKTVIEKIRMHFGSEVITEVGEVNLRELGKLVFKDHLARQRLEELVHPAIISSLLQRSKALASQGIPLLIWDVPLLFETGLDKLVDEIWVVWVDLETQLKRIVERDALPLEEIRVRIKAQTSLDEKAKAADVFIDNSGSWAETEVQLEKEWKRIKEGKQWQEHREQRDMP